MGIEALSSALSGLTAQRRRIDVIGHNVANASTKGYSRQNVGLASRGRTSIGIHAGITNHNGGVDVSRITRSRDSFLELRVLGERASASHLNTSTEYMASIEQVFGEPSDSGIAASMDRMWSGFDDVSNYPDQLPPRSIVVGSARAVADQIQDADRSLRSVHNYAGQQLGGIVAEVNNLTIEVAQLNRSISNLSGTANPNDLLDQRDLAVSRLSELVGVRTDPQSNGMVSLYVGGTTLLAGGLANQVSVQEVADPALSDVGLDRFAMQLTSGLAFEPTGGTARGVLDGANSSVVDAVRDLNAVAGNLVSTVNSLHSGGQDLAGSPGGNLFDPTGVTASTIRVDSGVAGDPTLLAAAALGAGQLDGSNAAALADLRDSTDGPDSLFAAMIVDNGLTLSSLSRRSTAQRATLDRVNEARVSARAVNIDEEMVDLVQAQRSYEASARLISTINELLDTMINRMGR